MIEVIRLHSRPGTQEHTPLRGVHSRLAVHRVRASAQQNTYAIHLQAPKSLQASLDDPLVAPAHQPERCCAMQEVVLLRAFPYEVPGMIGIHADRPPVIAGSGSEGTLVALFETAFCVN